LTFIINRREYKLNKKKIELGGRQEIVKERNDSIGIYLWVMGGKYVDICVEDNQFVGSEWWHRQWDNDNQRY